MGRKANMRKGKISEGEIDIVLSTIERMSEDNYPDDAFENESIRKAPVGVVYLYRLCRDELIASGHHYPHFKFVFQNLMASLLDMMGLRRKAVRVFAAMIAEHERRGSLVRVLAKESRAYAKYMRKFDFGETISQDFYDDLHEEIGWFFDCRYRMDAYYREDGRLISVSDEFETYSMFDVMMARALFGGDAPNYAKIVELVFFTDDEMNIDLNAEVSVPRTYAEATDSTEDVDFLASAFALSEGETKLLQYLYNQSVLDGCDEMDYLFDNSDEGASRESGSWLCNKYSVLLGFGDAEALRCTDSRSKLKRYGMISCCEIEGDVKSAILNKDVGIMFSDIMEQDSLTKTYPLATFQVSSNDTRVLKRLLCSSVPVNLLIYGPAGTGKTEYVRSLVRECGLDCFSFKNGAEIYGNSEIDPMVRLNAFVRMENCKFAVVIDEAENILNCLSGDNDLTDDADAIRKGVVNKMLDGCNAKVIWILNDMADVDRTTLRRMTYSVEMPRFSKAYFRKLMRSKLAEAKLPADVCNRIAELSEKYEVPLSTLDNIIKTLSGIGDCYV